jgi:hypothetical protein
MMACETADEKEQVIINANIPAEIKLGKADTLKFHISSLRPLNRIRLHEILSTQDTVARANIGSSTLNDSTYNFNANFIYDPGKEGVKQLFLYVMAADIYEVYYNFNFSVTE